MLLLLDNHQSGVSSHSSTSGLNAGSSDSQGNQHHVSLVDIRPFPKEVVGEEIRKRKSRMKAVLTDTLVMAALELEVQAYCKPVKRNRCNRLFDLPDSVATISVARRKHGIYRRN